MSKELLLLWLVTELWWLYLTPAASEDKVIGFLGQSVTLPCHYPSWSQSRNSMCWGKGACPNSKCSQELIHTDGRKITSRKSLKYTLRGSIWWGEVSLTISNTDQGDSGVYCCRIEVPGWFNDVKKTVHLELRRAPTTTKATTTTGPTSTSYMTTTELPTIVMTTPEPTSATLPQTLATSVLTTAATTCPSTTPSSFLQETTSFTTSEIFTKGSAITVESETVSSSSMVTTSAGTALLIPTGSEAWILSSTSQQLTQETVRVLWKTSKCYQLLSYWRVTEANCLQRHKRPDNIEDCKSVLSDMSHVRDDEDGIFTL
ncbi:Timd4 [Phodopus roborovskii]|uniref:Timd4 protein n=1 Tax=Phodopus roborovskii TaxID=109678 RepID=A0AAU9Z1E3_PHORO|nr:Timd4 [Phodopus roborovskii]